MRHWRWWRWKRARHVPAIMRTGVIVLTFCVRCHQIGRDRVEHRAALQIPDHLRCSALQLQSTCVNGSRLVDVLGLGSYGGQAFLIRGVRVIVLSNLQPQDTLGAANQLYHVVVRHLTNVVAIDGDQVVASTQAGILRRTALYDAAKYARLLARYSETEALCATNHLDCSHPIVHPFLFPPVLMHVYLSAASVELATSRGIPGKARTFTVADEHAAVACRLHNLRPHASTLTSILLRDVPLQLYLATVCIDSLRILEPILPLSTKNLLEEEGCSATTWRTVTRVQLFLALGNPLVRSLPLKSFVDHSSIPSPDESAARAPNFHHSASFVVDRTSLIALHERMFWNASIEETREGDRPCGKSLSFRWLAKLEYKARRRRRGEWLAVDKEILDIPCFPYWPISTFQVCSSFNNLHVLMK